MSTLRVSSIKNASSATGGLDIAADGSVSGALPSPNRNLLYNGAMQVAQRGTSTTGITGGGYYTADRWSQSVSSLGTWTQDIQNDAPSGSGFRRSLRVLCTTASSSPAAGGFCFLSQPLEGQDVQRIAKGTASAQRLTLSFWVKSNVTGTYIVQLEDNDNGRAVSASYSINAANTWERETITFSADTTGVLDNDNAASLSLQMWLAAGSNFSSGSLQTAWGAQVNANRAAGQTNLAAATNNYWQVTGVQLEVGDTATPFEFKSFGQELRECQRYYYRVFPPSGSLTAFGTGQCDSATGAVIYIPYQVSMRATPTALEQSGTASHYRVTSATLNNLTPSGVLTFNVANQFGAEVYVPVSSGLVAGNAAILRSINASAYLAWSAEL